VSSLPCRYLAVDGPIGVGKTTLVDMLVRRFEGVKVLENPGNPFLPEFYDDQPGSAFSVETYFLLQRYKQQQDILQQGLFEKLVICDYNFPKNRIFAYLNLTDDELALFDKLYTLLEPKVPVPDLVIYLVADIDTCMARVRQRRRDFERNLAPEYMRSLIDAYNHYYHYYSRSPLLVVDTRQLNFPERRDDFEELVRRLERPVKGTEYYVPLRAR
jgi:deoxyadenosine/deoxycytidine kinase